MSQREDKEEMGALLEESIRVWGEPWLVPGRHVTRFFFLVETNTGLSRLPSVRLGPVTRSDF